MYFMLTLGKKKEWIIRHRFENDGVDLEGFELSFRNRLDAHAALYKERGEPVHKTVGKLLDELSMQDLCVF